MNESFNHFSHRETDVLMSQNLGHNVTRECRFWNCFPLFDDDNRTWRSKILNAHTFVSSLYFRNLFLNLCHTRAFYLSLEFHDFATKHLFLSPESF